MLVDKETTKQGPVPVFQGPVPVFHLSCYELVWLYYNGLTYGKNKLKPLIERYAKLKNLRNDLLVQGIDVGNYAESAYQKIIPDAN